MNINESSVHDTDTRVYEVGFHVVPSKSLEDAQEESRAIASYIESKGGVMRAEDAPQLIDLAYEMTKKATIGGEARNYTFDSAYFGALTFEILPDAVPQLKSDLAARPNLIRTILIEVGPEALAEKAKRKEEAEAKKNEPETVQSDEAAVAPVDLDKTIDALASE